MTITNFSLFIAGILSTIAAVVHILIIFGGAAWYEFFGAGEKMVKMAEAGSYYPSVITALIAIVLFIWGLYAFSGAGLVKNLPFMKFCLITISAVYLCRALAGIAYYVVINGDDSFMLYSSLVCLIFALVYILGTIQVYGNI
jgi:putative oxidoreductase